MALRESIIQKQEVQPRPAQEENNPSSQALLGRDGDIVFRLHGHH